MQLIMQKKETLPTAMMTEKYKKIWLLKGGASKVTKIAVQKGLNESSFSVSSLCFCMYNAFLHKMALHDLL